MGDNFPFFLAGSLAICVGFRTFIPVLLMIILARAGILDLELLNPVVRTLVTQNEIFLYLIGTSVFVEILAGKTENLGEYCDTINFFLRPVTGGFIMYSFITLNDPILNIASALVLGTIFSLPFANLRTEAKMMNRALALRRYNFYLSLTEDFEALVGSYFAIVSPYLSISLIPLGFLLTLHRFKDWKRTLLALKPYPVDTPGESNAFDKERERVVNQNMKV
jgi:hypothetical protein